MVVAARMNEKDLYSSDSSVTYFGHVAAPVRIARSALDEDEGYSIMLDMRTPNPERVAKQLQSQDDDAYTTVLPPILGDTPTTARLSTFPTLNEDRLCGSILRFAGIAQNVIR